MTRFNCSFLVAVALVVGAGAAQARAEVAGDKIYQKALRSTVEVQVRVNGKTVSWGTGWVVDVANRLIVTNDHVVGKADTVYIVFPMYKDGRVVTDRARYDPDDAVSGRVLDSDPSRDLAVIRVPALPAGVPALKLSADRAQTGEMVHLVGNPGASGGMWTYTSGRVRGVNRRVLHDGGRFGGAQVVETEMPSNPGDSGSAVVNNKCEVVAVMYARHPDPQVRLMSFATDRSELQAFLAEVRSFLGGGEPSALTLANRGERFLMRGRIDQAITDLNAALRKDKDLVAAYRHRGRAYARKGDHDSALTDLNEAVRRKEDALAYQDRGLVWLDKNDRAKAIDDFTRAIRLQPANAVLYALRGLAYRLDKQFPSALRDLDEAIRRNDRLAFAYEQRGAVHFASRAQTSAVRDYARALALGPTPNRWNLLGVALSAGNDHKTAIEAFTQALNTGHPDTALVRSNRGFSRAALRQHRDAIADFTLALRSNPRYAPAFFGRGSCWEDLEDGANAHLDYVEAVRLNPEYDKLVPLHNTRALRVKNATGKPIRVYLRYSRKVGGRLVWRPKKEIAFDIQPGQTANLGHKGRQIIASSIRTRAVTLDGRGSWAVKTTSLVGAGPYRARRPGSFTFQFLP
jgi:tetratricopeptide (TPR) repeat protein